MWDGSSLWNSMGHTKYILILVLSRRDLEFAMATRPYWNEMVTCPILWYIRIPNWSRWRGYGTTPSLLTRTCFAHFVHRQALAPATITQLFFVVMKASSLLFQTPPNSRVSILHVASVILAIPRSPICVGTAVTASWIHSAELPCVLEYLFM